MCVCMCVCMRVCVRVFKTGSYFPKPNRSSYHACGTHAIDTGIAIPHVKGTPRGLARVSVPPLNTKSASLQRLAPDQDHQGKVENATAVEGHGVQGRSGATRVAARVAVAEDEDGREVAREADGGGGGESVCEGWVWKQGDWRNPDFQRRWFKLARGPTGARLFYYDSREDDKGNGSRKPKGSLVVAGMSVETEVPPPRASAAWVDERSAPCFAIIPARVPENAGHVRRIVCRCDLAEDKRRWVDALAAAGAKRAERRYGKSSGPADVKDAYTPRTRLRGMMERARVALSEPL
jgi:hypothetical protein